MHIPKGKLVHVHTRCHTPWCEIWKKPGGQAGTVVRSSLCLYTSGRRLKSRKALFFFVIFFSLFHFLFARHVFFFFFFQSSLLLSSLTRKRFYPQRSSGQAVVRGVVPSPPPRYVPSTFIADRVQHSHCSSIFIECC